MKNQSVIPLSKFHWIENTLGIETNLWNEWIIYSKNLDPKGTIPHRDRRKFFRDLFIEFASQHNIEIPNTRTRASHFTVSKKFIKAARRRMRESESRDLAIFKEFVSSNLSLEELGKKYNMSRERIRQIIQNVSPGYKRIKTYIEEINGTVISATNLTNLRKKIIAYRKEHYIEDRKSLFWDSHKVDNSTGCWIWTGKSYPTGYGKFHLLGERYAHRISYLLTYGKIPPKMEVLHRCDNPPCINPDHLKLGTHQDNIDDREERYKGIAPTKRTKNHPKRMVHQTP